MENHTPKRNSSIDILDKLISIKECRLNKIENSEVNESGYVLDKRQTDILIKEIAELKEKRENLLSGKEVGSFTGENDLDEDDKVFQLSWDDIIFDHKVIIFKVNNKKYTIRINKSRKSFNLIKSSFIKRMPQLEFRFEEGVLKLKDAENMQYLKDVLHFLKFRNTFKMKNMDKNEYVKEYIANFSDRTIPSLFFPKDKSPYLEYLCKIQSPGRPIIPLVENVIHSDSTTKEDAFIFTLETYDSLYLVWENVNISRATYVFSTNKKNYIKNLQLIFDFATSDIINKRFNIRRNFSMWEQLRLIRIIQHITLMKWYTSLPFFLRAGEDGIPSPHDLNIYQYP